MDEFQLLLDLVVAVVAATVAWTVVSLFRAAVRALTPGCSQGALAPRHGLSWTLRGRFQSQGLSPLLWIVFVPGLLLGVTCSASSAPALPPAASAGRRKRESPTSLLLDRTGCDLTERLRQEPYMKANSTMVQEGSHVWLRCINRPTDPPRTFLCESGRLTPKPVFTCNFYCLRLRITDHHEDMTVKYRQDQYAAPIYRADGHVWMYSCSNEGLKHPKADKTTQCKLVKTQSGTYVPSWQPHPRCFFHGFQRCQSIPRQLHSRDFTTSNLYSNTTGELFLGDVMKVMCKNRQDRSLLVRCSLDGWEEMPTSGQEYTLNTMCENPCPAALVEYDRGGPKNQYLVRQHIGDDMKQRFPENFSIPLRCALGYRAQTENSSCRFRMSTRSFQWLPPPKCAWEEPCQIADLMRDDWVDVSWVGDNRTQARASCPEEYKLKGSSMYVCSNGKWIEDGQGMESARLLSVPRRSANASLGSSQDSFGNAYPTCIWKLLQDHCENKSKTVEQLREKHLKRAAGTTINDRSMRVACKDGYHLSTGRATELLQCGDDLSALIIPDFVHCQEYKKICINPIAGVHHETITSVDPVRSVPIGRSVLFMCRNNRGRSINATCTEDGWDSPPLSLSCPNPCRRPCIQYEVSNHVVFNASCLGPDCENSHTENASIAFNCNEKYRPQHARAMCTWSESDHRYAWLPTPTCVLSDPEAYCKHEEILNHQPANGRCILRERPRTGLYLEGTKITCECKPGTRASARGNLYCWKAMGGMANWTTDDGKPLKCTKLKPPNNVDPCPQIPKRRCQKVLRRIVHFHTSRREVFINTKGRSSTISTNVNSVLKRACDKVTIIIRFWVPYSRPPGRLQADASGLLTSAGKQPAHLMVSLREYNYTSTVSTSKSHLDHSNRTLKLFGPAKTANSTQNDACVSLTVSAPPTAEGSVKVEWTYGH